MKECKVVGCNRSYRAKGYCDTHDRQIKKYGKIFKRISSDPNEIILHENYAEIVLYNRHILGVEQTEKARTLISLEDVERCSNLKWYLSGTLYVCSGGKEKAIYLHKLIMNGSKDNYVDHINHNKLDNRRLNLRICTNQQNAMNRVKAIDNTSGTTGVTWHKASDSWLAKIGCKHKCIHLGIYKNKEDAIKARKEAEVKYFGEFRYQEGKDASNNFFR